MEYVAGFMYSEDETQVALIRKIKPLWQAGSLNGIGGKIERGEFPYDAMVREFEEETGCKDYKWSEFCRLSGDNYVVYFFSSKGDLSLLESKEEEQVEIHNIKDIFDLQVIPNLRWLIPLGIDKDRVGGDLMENHRLVLNETI